MIIQEKPADFYFLHLQRQIIFFSTQLGLALIFRARIGILARLYRLNTEIRRVTPANKNVFFFDKFQFSNLVRFSNVFAVRFSLLPLRRSNYRPNRHSMAFSCYRDSCASILEIILEFILAISIK